LGVGPPDRLGRCAAWSTREAVADDAIYDEGDVPHAPDGCRWFDWYAHPLENIPLPGRRPRKRIASCGESHVHLGAPSVETTGADHGAATIAAAPREDQDALPGWSPVEKAHARYVREVPARILHHLNEVDVQVLDHRSVHRDHLLGGEKRHRLDAWEHRLARELATAETNGRCRGLA
jgi:hypothetical protein